MNKYLYLDATVFVYRCTECSRWYTVYCNETITCPVCRSKEREYTATIDPGVFIEHLLNNETDLSALKGT